MAIVAEKIKQKEMLVEKEKAKIEASREKIKKLNQEIEELSVGEVKDILKEYDMSPEDIRRLLSKANKSNVSE